MSNNLKIKQPTPSFTSLEPVWTYETRLNTLETSLNKKIDGIKDLLDTKITKDTDLSNRRLDNFINNITANIIELDRNAAEVKNELLKSLQILQATMDKYKAIIKADLETQHAETTQKLLNISNIVNSFTSRVKNFGVKSEDTASHLKLTFTDLLNELETFLFNKTLPDNKTIVKNSKDELAVNYGFNESTFKKDLNNNFYVTGLHLQSSGKVISADRINNDLNNATYNIGAITAKLEAVLTKLAQVNHYVASNNFKKDKLDLEVLDEFAIKCLSSSSAYIKREEIPVGTKIKNTHNNHIWVFNEFKLNGNTTLKWEDFGSDLICMADNKGTAGLVTGSNERLRGYIDLNGVISINGLEEELADILNTLKVLEDDLAHFESTLSEHLYSIDARLDALEGR